VITVEQASRRGNPGSITVSIEPPWFRTIGGGATSGVPCQLAVDVEHILLAEPLASRRASAVGCALGILVRRKPIVKLQIV